MLGSRRGGFWAEATWAASRAERSVRSIGLWEVLMAAELVAAAGMEAACAVEEEEEEEKEEQEEQEEQEERWEWECAEGMACTVCVAALAAGTMRCLVV